MQALLSKWDRGKRSTTMALACTHTKPKLLTIDVLSSFLD